MTTKTTGATCGQTITPGAFKTFKQGYFMKIIEIRKIGSSYTAAYDHLAEALYGTYAGLNFPNWDTWEVVG